MELDKNLVFNLDESPVAARPLRHMDEITEQLTVELPGGPSRSLETEQAVAMMASPTAAPETKQAVFSAIVNSFTPDLTKYVRKIVESPQVTEEVTQQVYLKLWTSADKFKSQGPGSFGRWLKTVTRNEASNTVRKNRRSTPVNLSGLTDLDGNEPGHLQSQAIIASHPSQIANPVESLEFSEKLAQVNELPEIQRLPLLMYCMLDYSYGEIAAQLNITPPVLLNRGYSGVE